MSPWTNDLRGRTFGRLHIPAKAEPQMRGDHAYWPYVCECGAEGWTRGSRMVSGRTVSCGCWRADPAVRQAAAMMVSPRKRKARAKAGGAAFAAKCAETQAKP